jgi:hypothetical protein
VQMVATHEAALECFRRAALAEQTFAGREMGLKYGDKLVRSFAALTDALNRHRGKGQQVVRVEHVTVQAGGQAIVGAVTQGGGGDHNKSEDQAYAPRRIAHEPEPALRCPDPARETVPLAKRILRMWIYHNRNCVERLWARLKEWRAVAHMEVLLFGRLTPRRGTPDWRP